MVGENMIILKELKNFVNGTSSELDIKNYILEHPEDIERMSARELGKATFTSAASVTRFCRKLGYKGYPEFRFKFISEIKFSTTKTKESIELLAEENVVTIVRKVTEVQKRAIEETSEGISFEKLKRITENIHKAETVDFYAFDVNYYLTQYGSSQYFHARKKTNTYTATNMQAINALMSNEKHFAIFISHTGENGRLVEIAKILKEKKTKFLVITADKNSTLAELADECLFASAPKTFQEFLFPAFYSSVKYILDILWGIEFAMEYDKNIKLNKVYDKVGEASLWGLLKKNDWGYTK